MTEQKIEGLPFLPGNTFQNPTKSKFHIAHSLNYQNGYQVPSMPKAGVGGDRLYHNQISQQELNELANFNPTLTYGQAKQAPPEDFIPSFVAFDKKVLRFSAYWKETVRESPAEYYRVRPVDVYYYLEDDSIAIIEPEVKNSGIPQGKLIARQRLPKDDQGGTYHWKDLNMGDNMTVYGKTFHLVDCDQFTRDFLESEGIEVNPSEGIPNDPYIEKRRRVEEPRTYNTASDYDPLRQFLEMDRKVLRFFCVWDDRDQMYGELKPHIIHYYLSDDTMEVREVHEPNDGRDPFPLLISRHRIPKDRFNVKPSHPHIYMELTRAEVGEYFTPRDFGIGQTVLLYGRRFLIYEVDEFTKAWYYQNFGVTDFDPLDVKQLKPGLPKMEVPAYNGFGSLEDSLQNCLHLVPEPPKKDVVKMLDNEGKVLRYEAVMDSVKPEDQGRRFIFSFRLADDMLYIYEPPVKNSGWRGGKYLERSRVAKPHSTPARPEYYGPADFVVGAVVVVFGQRFVVTSADDFVLKYMEANPTKFSEESITTMKSHLLSITEREVHPKLQPISVRRNAGDINALISEVSTQLKKIGITGKDRIDQLFLQFDRDRTGWVDKASLGSQMKLLNLPIDDDILDGIVARCNPNEQGQICLEDFRKFFENS